MSENDLNRKVVIVGAGIAGCATALAANNDGHEIRIMESRSREEIIDHHTSFEALQNLTSRGDAIEYLSRMGLDIVPSYPYKGAVITGPSGNSIDLRLDRSHGYFIRRKGAGSLDHQMIELVEKRGMDIEFSTRFRRSDRKGNVYLKKKGRITQTRADIIIGADGIGTIVGRRISTPLKKNDIAVGIGYHFKGPHSFEPGIAQCWLGSKLCPGEYAYVLPSENEVTIVTTMRPHLMEKRSKPIDYIERFLRIPSIEKGLAGTRIINKVTGGVPVSSGGPIGNNNVLLVGEAARLTDPMLGFGMMNALISGHIAGSSISSPDPLTNYEMVLKEVVLNDLRSRIKARNRIIDTLNDRSIDEIIQLIENILINMDPNLFFDPMTRKRATLSAFAILLRYGGVRKAFNIFLPLFTSNFSLEKRNDHLSENPIIIEKRVDPITA